MSLSSIRRAVSLGVLVALVLGLLSTRARARADEDPPLDRVELADGTVLEGRVLLADDARVVLRIGSKEREVARADVKSVRSAAAALREVLAQWERIAPGDAAAILDLARFAGARGLTGESELFAYLVLTLEPANAAAHELLGHDARGDGWIVRDRSRKVAWPRIQEFRGEFRHAWELRSTHYELRTNLELASACALLLELELFYRHFHDTFGAPLGLYEVVERMPCEVHADASSYPDEQKRLGYFDSRTNTLYQLAVGGYVLEVLLHEATHQLLWTTSALERKGKGCIPDWLDEGLAEFLSATRSGPPERPVYAPELTLAGHFRAHAGARKPYDLGRVLNLAAADFATSSRVDLKYAQAYTLVHFAWHGDGGAHHAGFLEYLRRAYAGKATSSSFEDALGQKERALEKAWTAHVQALAKD
jgi:hypothetical protein